MSKQDYVNMYKFHGLYRSDIYLLDQTFEKDIYELFDEVCEELLLEKAINLQLPPEFRQAAQLLDNRDIITHLHFASITTRAFFLSDLIDFLSLIRAHKA